MIDDGREIVGRYIIGGNNKVLTLDEERIIYDADIENIIIPYFETFKTKFDELNERDYKIGVYGPRYVCTQLSRAGLTTRSFVCDMSSGFSGNIGRRLPANWAFDQISTVKVGNDEGLIEIDNNITSGKDDGAVVNPDAHFEPTETEKRKYTLIIVNSVLNQFHFRDLVSAELEFEKEVHIVTGPPVDVIVKPTLDIKENKNANFTIGVTNGEICDSSFTTAVSEAMSMISDITSADVPNYVSIAKEINNGRIEISVGVRDNKLIIENKYVILSSDTSEFNMDFAVIIRLEMSLELPKPVESPEVDWDELMYRLKTSKWGEVAVAAVLLLILGIAFYAVGGTAAVGGFIKAMIKVVKFT